MDEEVFNKQAERSPFGDIKLACQRCSIW